MPSGRCGHGQMLGLSLQYRLLMSRAENGHLRAFVLAHGKSIFVCSFAARGHFKRALAHFHVRIQNLAESRDADKCPFSARFLPVFCPFGARLITTIDSLTSNHLSFLFALIELTSIVLTVTILQCSLKCVQTINIS